MTKPLLPTLQKIVEILEKYDREVPFSDDAQINRFEVAIEINKLYTDKLQEVERERLRKDQEFMNAINDDWLKHLEEDFGKNEIFVAIQVNINNHVEVEISHLKNTEGKE